MLIKTPFYFLEAAVMRDVLRKNTLEIPISTVSFTKKKIHSGYFLQFRLEYNHILSTL